MSVNLRNIGGNALSILSSDVMNRATSFVLYAMVARRLGAFEFGQLSLALTLFYLFQIFAVAGLKILIVREVAKDRSQTGKCFVNSCVIAVFTSLVSLAVLFAFVRLVHYSRGTNLVILLLSLGLFPYAISAVCEGIFQAWERMRYIAYVNVPANIAKIIAAYFLLSGSRGLLTVILVLLGSLFLIAAIELWLVLRRFPVRQASLDVPFALATMRSASTFLGIDGTVAIESSLNVIFLSKLATEREVGVYSAATQLMVPLILVCQSIAQSIFPVMCRKVEPGLQTLRRITESAAEVLLMLALPTVAGIFWLGQWGLSVLYKNPAFLEAVPALRIMAPMLILQAFTSMLGQALVATHREKVTLRITLVDMLLNLTAGWLLIKYFGLRGAAVTLVLTRLAGCIQHYIPVARMLSGISLGKIIWKPLAAAACMAAYLAVPSSLAGALRGISASLIYGAALLALAIFASGGVRQFKARFFYSWYEHPPGSQEEAGL
jgi:O-antigen/teichoic acid export membrane protein